MKALVTGGTGFLGKQLAFRLKELGYAVSVLGRNRIVGEQLEAQGLRFLPVEITNREATVKACSGQDYIFHCAALSSPWGRYQDFYDANVLATRNIIQGCQNHGVKRLIHVSTTSVYFDFTHRLNISEATPLPKTPANAYAKTKRLAEQEIDKAHQAGLPVISIRPRAIFGIGDTAILPRLIKVSDRFGIPLINEGKACIDLTYVDNVVDALLLCQNAPDRLLGRTFNISNGEPMALATLLEMLFDKLGHPLKLKPISYQNAYGAAVLMELISSTILLGREPLLTRYSVGLLAFDQTLDITAAKVELGYQPRISIEEGLEIFAHWWNAQRYAD
jgi:nucleoside-diphosphate-sugar epimerase